MHDNVQKQVTEFLPHIIIIRPVDRIHDLIAFFDQSRAEAGVGLFAIPRASVRGAEAGYDFLQLRNGVYIFHKELLVFPNSLTSSVEVRTTKMIRPNITRIVPKYTRKASQEGRCSTASAL